MKLDKLTVRRQALALIAAAAPSVAATLAGKVGISRQGANGHLQAMIEDGLIEAQGSTRARLYRLKTLDQAQRTYPRQGLEEDIVWRETFAPRFAALPENVRRIWNYAVTEMTNNAIDHSGGTDVRVGFRRNAHHTEAWVADDGEGIFLKIQRVLQLHDAREALLELAKGKLTTAPENHTGQGIFFTSRMMDEFDIVSGALHFRHDARGPDILKEQATSETKGTTVRMRLTNDSARTTKSVFDAFDDARDPEASSFDKTVVPLRLAQYEGETLVSRSQAKRVASRFEAFKCVELDFAGVTEIGQAFADELFRVFVAAHPEVRLAAIHACPAVEQMIRRAVSERRSR